MTRDDIVRRGQRVLRLESEAIGAAADRLSEDFRGAVKLLTTCRGRVIVAGVGKSGLIGRKIAATLTSTGTPATFLHPADSVHGDLGIVGPEDVGILLSKSGESDELLALLAHLKGFGVKTVAVTGAPRSALARHADYVLDGGVREEACPHDLAPTTSTAVALALGDALAVVLLEEKGFQREDFARLHPGGAIGRKLVLKVDQVMVRDTLPTLTANATMKEAIITIAERRGIAIVVDNASHVQGLITAGDLSRLVERGDDLFRVPVGTVMTRNPKIARHDELASGVVYRMEQHGIMAMPVVDASDTLVGVVHLHDLMRARVV